jgi:hypothetical protein
MCSLVWARPQLVWNVSCFNCHNLSRIILRQPRRTGNGPRAAYGTTWQVGSRLVDERGMTMKLSSVGNTNLLCISFCLDMVVLAKHHLVQARSTVLGTCKPWEYIQTTSDAVLPNN